MVGRNEGSVLFPWIHVTLKFVNPINSQGLGSISLLFKITRHNLSSLGEIN